MERQNFFSVTWNVKSAGASSSLKHCFQKHVTLLNKHFKNRRLEGMNYFWKLSFIIIYDWISSNIRQYEAVIYWIPQEPGKSVS